MLIHNHSDVAEKADSLEAHQLDLGHIQPHLHPHAGGDEVECGHVV